MAIHRGDNGYLNLKTGKPKDYQLFFSGLGERFIFNIPPQQVSYILLERATVTQTLNGMWADDYGEGIVGLAINGSFGWGIDAQTGRTGKQTMAKLVALWQNRAIQVKNQNPDNYRIQFVDYQRGCIFECISPEFHIDQNQQSPLLIRYQMTFQVLKTVWLFRGIGDTTPITVRPSQPTNMLSRNNTTLGKNLATITGIRNTTTINTVTPNTSIQKINEFVLGHDIKTVFKPRTGKDITDINTVTPNNSIQAINQFVLGWDLATVGHTNLGAIGAFGGYPTWVNPWLQLSLGLPPTGKNFAAPISPTTNSTQWSTLGTIDYQGLPAVPAGQNYTVMAPINQDGNIVIGSTTPLVIVGQVDQRGLPTISGTARLAVVGSLPPDGLPTPTGTNRLVVMGPIDQTGLPQIGSNTTLAVANQTDTNGNTIVQSGPSKPVIRTTTDALTTNHDLVSGVTNAGQGIIASLPSKTPYSNVMAVQGYVTTMTTILTNVLSPAQTRENIALNREIDRAIEVMTDHTNMILSQQTLEPSLATVIQQSLAQFTIVLNNYRPVLPGVAQEIQPVSMPIFPNVSNDDRYSRSKYSLTELAILAYGSTNQAYLDAIRVVNNMPYNQPNYPMRIPFVRIVDRNAIVDAPFDGTMV